MRTKTLILIRHAHRDTAKRSADNGLSAKGERQAEALLRYFIQSFPTEKQRGKSPRILSSPKKRCVETVLPIAREISARVETVDDLSEQRQGESDEDFRERIEGFVLKWRKDKGYGALTLVCAHGDGLPIALLELTGARVRLNKGAWAEVLWEDADSPRLEWLIQTLKSRS